MRSLRGRQKGEKRARFRDFCKLDGGDRGVSVDNGGLIHCIENGYRSTGTTTETKAQSVDDREGLFPRVEFASLSERERRKSATLKKTKKRRETYHFSEPVQRSGSIKLLQLDLQHLHPIRRRKLLRSECFLEFAPSRGKIGLANSRGVGVGGGEEGEEVLPLRREESEASQSGKKEGNGGKEGMDARS
jgi:hypothetical protein